jgi:hypothetical protein
MSKVVVNGDPNDVGGVKGSTDGDQPFLLATGLNLVYAKIK